MGVYWHGFLKKVSFNNLMIVDEFFSRDAETVARDLLGCEIEKEGKKGVIVETEAYFGSEDPASRACQNGDLRETMMMDAGTILVYGVHNSWLVNFVTGLGGDAQAVLIRAIEPLNFDIDCSGPGKLTKAFGIDKGLHKGKVGDGILVRKGKGDFEIVESFRIGVREDLKKPMRFYIKDNKFVSRK